MSNLSQAVYLVDNSSLTNSAPVRHLLRRMNHDYVVVES